MVLLRRVIGTVLRRVRTGQGRTLHDVARAAGVSLPYLSEIERGRKEPSSEVLAAICRALGLGLIDLLELAREELIRSGVAPARFTVPASRPAVPRQAASTHRPPHRPPAVTACVAAARPGRARRTRTRSAVAAQRVVVPAVLASARGRSAPGRIAVARG